MELLAPSAVGPPAAADGRTPVAMTLTPRLDILRLALERLSFWLDHDPITAPALID
jgi:hypothetical protein